MTYREAGHACPSCRVGMREFQGRLICDACGSMLIAVDDFTRQLTASEELIVRDDTKTQRACPRCDGQLASAKVALGRLIFDGEILHCKAHGLWFEAGLLEDVLRQVQRHHRGPGVGTPRGGGVSGFGVGQTMTGAAYRSVAEAFSRSGDPNEPLRWWEKHRVVQHTPFASAFSQQHLACPKCAGKLALHGSVWGCDAGDGAFVEYSALEQMFFDMSARPWEAPAPSGAAGKRACPACSAFMLEQDLEEVPIDRCSEHGIWFDSGELERALQHGTQPRGSWFRRLFWPH